jgi:predicted metal-dependent TIM-barrel fold hydrolase
VKLWGEHREKAKVIKIIEPHIHMYSRTTDDYQRMYKANIRVCVEPSFWLGTNRRYADTFLDYFELILSFETVRAKRFGIEHYATVSVNPKEAENLKIAEKVLKKMPLYLKHPRCLGIGEIGFNLITKNEEKIFISQLKMAKEKNVLAIIHTPHDTPKVSKKDGVIKIMEIIKNTDYNYNHILVDHNTEATIGLAKKLPVWTGLTVYPYSKLNPKRVVNILKKHGLEQMMVNSSADWGVSDPTSLAKTAQHMKEAGFKQKEIKKVIFDNPMEFYSQLKKFKPDLNLKPVPVREFQR